MSVADGRKETGQKELGAWTYTPKWSIYGMDGLDKAAYPKARSKTAAKGAGRFLEADGRSQSGWADRSAWMEELWEA